MHKQIVSHWFIGRCDDGVRLCSMFISLSFSLFLNFPFVFAYFGGDYNYNWLRLIAVARPKTRRGEKTVKIVCLTRFWRPQTDRSIDRSDDRASSKIRMHLSTSISNADVRDSNYHYARSAATIEKTGHQGKWKIAKKAVRLRSSISALSCKCECFCCRRNKQSNFNAKKNSLNK